MTPDPLIYNILRKHLDMDQTMVFLFGSRSAGKGNSRSDYDIGVFQGQKIPLSKLELIEEELEASDIAVHVDVVDFARVNNKFKEVALKKYEIWNKPKIDLKLT
jgi:predicted nucleotidyltransferase